MWAVWTMTDFQSYYYMATHTDIGREEDQKINGYTTFVRTVRTWICLYSKHLASVGTGQNGETLFSTWAARAQGHRHRCQGHKSKISQVCHIDFVIVVPLTAILHYCPCSSNSKCRFLTCYNKVHIYTDWQPFQLWWNLKKDFISFAIVLCGSSSLLSVERQRNHSTAVYRGPPTHSPTRYSDV